MSHDKDQLIHSLRSHRVNTLMEIRRIEKALVPTGSPDIYEPLASAWLHFVNSNNLLNELRSLTKDYPFSSECLDEAKALVLQDPSSSRSWNYCWLVLQKIHDQQLISKHAWAAAAKPEMWGGCTPDAGAMESLANVLLNEWARVVHLMLRHWEIPPIR
ncbi:hypothetical protein MGYG_00276 [Nannizzia gypsea CBS 118893]|uniref:Uncharacterized protein n=1 Tax=Arthroderma gypseum (strain ATCC MYA-4604 / CBS 118893) TaxID=535722 RepID=E5QYE2_ARTGP|nr:hypothetical protein MGYG_00276 [Nannizzia gypsea CBS 118893]EFQ97234.1 hypothetical protein MGYG_00276 [Nannizzia gypsea CBS 118893]